MSDELQKQLRKRLENLLKLPENQICCDCNKRGPRWASVNLGVFFCIDCSGIHRNLGVHISFVRSINLDSWKVEQVEKMEQWGNKRANEYYEANLPANVYKPKDGDSVKVVEKFIRDKYEHKRYIAKSMPPPRVESDSNVSDNFNDNRGNNGNRNEPITRQRPSHKSTPVAKAPPAPALLDFMDMSAPPEPVVAQPPPAPAPAFVDNSFETFQNFESSANFVASPSAAPQPPQKQQASADAILSLYNLPGMSAMGGQMGAPMMGAPMGAPQQQFQNPGYPPQQQFQNPSYPNPYGMQGVPMGQPMMGGQQMPNVPMMGGQMPNPMMMGGPMSQPQYPNMPPQYPNMMQQPQHMMPQGYHNMQQQNMINPNMQQQQQFYRQQQQQQQQQQQHQQQQHQQAFSNLGQFR